MIQARPVWNCLWRWMIRFRFVLKCRWKTIYRALDFLFSEAVVVSLRGCPFQKLWPRYPADGMPTRRSLVSNSPRTVSRANALLGGEITGLILAGVFFHEGLERGDGADGIVRGRNDHSDAAVIVVELASFEVDC